MVGWCFVYSLVSVECHLKTCFLIRFPVVIGQEEAIEPLPPLSPFPAPFVSCPFPSVEGFFCLFRFFLFVLHSYGESATENWQAVIVSCFPETVHYDPWATSRLEGCRNLCCCVSMHVAVKLVWEQRKLVHGSRVKWAVFCLAYYAFVIFRNRLDSSK